MEKRILLIGLVFLFFFSSVFPILVGLDVKILEIKKQLSNLINTLYVGGTGPNNYTKIQDAIDNASDSDTVFVFAGTYYEKIEIPKSIALIGENINLTTIDIDHIYPLPQGGIVMHVINASNVTIDGFNFRNHFSINNITGGIWAENCPGLTISNISDTWHHTVDFGFRLISSDHSTITRTLLKYKTESAIDIVDSLDVIISENYILGGAYSCGISLIDSENITITNNTITKCMLYGIYLLNSDKNNLIRNNVQDNYDSGIYILHSNYNLISNNELSFNQMKGIFINNSKYNIINKNNIYNNGEKYIFFCNAFLNKWNANFWGYSSPKIHIINGEINFKKWNISFLIWKIDWHPAKEPYDILKTLTIWVSKSPIYQGETLIVKILSGTSTVSDVKVTIGEETALTDKNGEVHFTMPDPGVESAIYTITAEKEGYITAEKSITLIKLPTMSFVQDDIENTITVVSFSPSNLSWDIIEITGDCNLSGLGENVTVGDKITDCHGVIKIIFIPLNLLMAEFNFSDD